MSRGKSFERDLKHAIERAGCLAYRNVDAMYGKGSSSVRSLPDLWAMASNGTVALVECKAVKGKSIPFNRLADHQRDHLAKFNDHALSFYGYVAILFYGDKPRWKRAVVVPISEWLSAEQDLGRKSLPLDEAMRIGTELKWTPGVGWEIPKLTTTWERKHEAAAFQA